MVAEKLVDNRALKIAGQCIGRKPAVHDVEGGLFTAAGEQDWVFSKGLLGAVRPLTRAQRLVLALVVQFFPEQFL